MVEIGICYLQTFGKPKDIESIVLGSSTGSENPGEEPTCILNKHYPRVRVPVSVKSLLEAQSLDIGGKKKSSSALCRILLRKLFKDEEFHSFNGTAIIKRNNDIIKSSIRKY